VSLFCCCKMDNVDCDETLMKYRRSVTEKASDTIHELRQILEHEPVVGSAMSQSDNQAELVERCDYSYGAAGERLRSMLANADVSQSRPAKTVLFSEPPPHQVSKIGTSGLARNTDTVTSDELSKMMHGQAHQMHQLHTQNQQLMTKMEKQRRQLLEVVEENQVLHAELKRSVVDDIVRTAGVPPTSVFVPPAVSLPTLTPAISSHHTWQTELERISSLHKAKTSTLEAQLQHSKEECSRREQQVKELEAKLHVVETGNNWTGQMNSLCANCAQNEAISTPALQLTVDTLTHERDELVSELARINVHVRQLLARETDAYQQVKSCIELAEQSQMDMSQAVIEKEQVREQLDNLQRRFEENIVETQQRISAECDVVRRASESTCQQLEARVKELVEQLTEMQCSLEKCSREKTAVTAELEAARSQLSSIDVDYSKATDNMKLNVTQAHFERNLAVQQMSRLKQEVDQLGCDRHAEKCRLKSELEDVKRRLAQAEKEVITAKEECIQLHETNQTLHKQLNTMQLAKESIERSCSDNIDAAERRAELREVELNKLIVTQQAKLTESNSQLEAMVAKHELLVQKLRDECRRLLDELQQVSSKYKADNSRLRRQNKELQSKVEWTSRQCRELSNRVTQQSQLQEKMRLRLSDLDCQAQRSSQQKLDLLAKESVLVRDRQQLVGQVEFLQRQLMTPAVSSAVIDTQE